MSTLREGQNIDTVQHTLQECTAWMAEREEIMRQVRIGNAEELTLRGEDPPDNRFFNNFLQKTEYLLH